MDHDELEAHNQKLQRKYDGIEKEEVDYEEYMLDDAEFVAVGYGIVSRVLRTTVDFARESGIRIGLFRPKTLWPFPTLKIQKLCNTVKKFLVVEMSNGQMVNDVRLAVEGRVPVEFYGRMGGVVPSAEELLEIAKKL